MGFHPLSSDKNISKEYIETRLSGEESTGVRMRGRSDDLSYQ